MPMTTQDIEEGQGSSGNEAVTGLRVHSLRAQRISDGNSVPKGRIFIQVGVTTQLALGFTILEDIMHRRAGSLGVVRACIQSAASCRWRLLYNLNYTFITDIGSFMIGWSHNTIGLSKPSDRSLCSQSSLLGCSEVFASKQTNKQYSEMPLQIHADIPATGSFPI